MAQRVIDSGAPTTLWARKADTLEPYTAGPARIAADLVELGAASDVLCICVVDDAGVDEVLRGSHGALAGMKPGGTVVIHSTTSPDTCRRLQADYSTVRFVDAPVSGGGGRAAEGELLVMVGGEVDAVQDVRPVLATFGNPILHLGALGSGQEAKLLNNALFTAQLALAANVFELAAARGLDLPALSSVLRDGSSRSYAAEILAGVGHRLETMASIAGPLLAKDVGILAGVLAPARPMLIEVADAGVHGMMDGHGSSSLGA
jgi:3-hydroxyisobutyrate dehydrogenase-like beta-hydroxyacid dehydrogenase